MNRNFTIYRFFAKDLLYDDVTEKATHHAPATGRSTQGGYGPSLPVIVTVVLISHDINPVNDAEEWNHVVACETVTYMYRW